MNNLKKENTIVSNYILLVLVVFLADIFLITRLKFSGTIRVQDIAVLLGLPVIYLVIKEISHIMKLKKMVLVMSIYIFYLVFSNLLFYISGSIDTRFILYIAKEFEFFMSMYFMIYSVIFNFNKTIKIINIFLWVNIFYGLSQFILGRISYYGIGALIGTEPAASGIVYFTCSLMAILLWIYSGKKLSLVQFILSVFLTIMTISKTSMLGIVSFIIIILVIYAVKYITKNIKFSFKNIILAYVSLSSIIIVYLGTKLDLIKINNIFFNRVIARLSRGVGSLSYRMNKSDNLFQIFNSDSITNNIFGSGKGVPEYYFGTSTLGVDNQFVRAIIEMGLIGIILWIGILASLLETLKSTIRANKNIDAYYYFMVALIITFLIMGIGYEVFQTTRSGLAFWLVVGLCLSLASKKE